MTTLAVGKKKKNPENTATITAQLFLFKLPFTYEQLNLIISAKLYFTAVRKKQNKTNHFSRIWDSWDLVEVLVGS